MFKCEGGEVNTSPAESSSSRHRGQGVEKNRDVGALKKTQGVSYVTTESWREVTKKNRDKSFTRETDEKTAFQ